jgi:5-methylthioribose kinase
LLTAGTVGPYLMRRGLVESDAIVHAAPLGGGVSNIVLSVRVEGGGAMVVKQSLPQLRVASEWLAKRERIVTEALALRWAACSTPSIVPAVLDVDPASFTMVIEHAPAGWHDWKARLLAGDADPEVAARLGEVLATWHGASRHDGEIAKQADDAEAFDQLRVDPYYRAIMPKHPDLAPEIAGYIDRMQATHRCLVHGDFSPKNVLLGAEGMWVVDFEVAHMGDPAFDLAFMHNHLMLKALHTPGSVAAYESCAMAFAAAYQAGVGAFGGPMSYVLGHAGCMMVARVDGKSPAEYLTAEGQIRARALGRALIAAPPASHERGWYMLRKVVTL